MAARILAQNWWAMAARGAVAAIFGLVVLLWPGLTLGALTGLVAVLALADGMFALVAAGRDRRRSGTSRRIAFLMEGIASVVLGLLVLSWDEPTVFALLAMAGVRAFVLGALELLAARQFWRALPGAGLLALAGATSLVFGVVQAVAPSLGLAAIVLGLGGYALAVGALFVALALRLRASLLAERAANVAPAQQVAASAPVDAVSQDEMLRPV